MEKKTIFLALRTDRGYFVTDEIENDHFRSSLIESHRLKFDGEKPEKTWHKKWVLIKKHPEKITKEVARPNINGRYEIRDKIKFPNLPEIVKDKDAIIQESSADNHYNKKYGEGFESIKSLYEHKSDPQDPIDEPIEYEFHVIGQMNQVPDKGDFSYEVMRTSYESDGTWELKADSIITNLLDRIVTPPIIRHTIPSSLSSEDSYKIIRQYVRSNIDTRYAQITSDYDFCFTVEKVIKMAESEEYRVNQNAWTKRKPKYVTLYRSSRKVKVFEMTWSPKCYQGYKAIEGFKGKNQKDLKFNINKYLINLITDINKPLKECPKCKGLGVVISEDLK